jgi:methyl-accepting chemotaxis protein
MLSIRNSLTGAFVVVSVALAGVVGKSTINAYSVYEAQATASTMTAVDRALFNALLNFRIERGDTGTALQLPRSATAAAMDSVKVARGKVDAAMTEAAAAMSGVGDTATVAAFSNVTSLYGRVQSQRQKIDGALLVEPAERPKGLDVEAFTLGTDFLAVLEKASLVLQGGIRTADPSMVALAQARALAWSARSNGGTSAVVMNVPIGEKRAFVGDETFKVAASDSAMLLAWNAVKALIDHPSVAQSLKDAVTKADSAYFSGDLAKWRQTIIADLQAGRPSVVGIDEWRVRITAALGAVASVASLSMEELMSEAAAQKQAALVSLSIYGSMLLLALMIAGIGLYIVLGRVVRPISTLTQCMGELAGGRLDVDIAGAGRKDEIGAMARSVEVFREAAIRNRRLETEAEENRLTAERERVETQARAEAEAEERLTQATGELAAGLRRLAAGDMLCEIDRQFAPKFETLRHDFNTSVSQLRNALVGVGQAVSTVTDGSKEISEASDTLAKRTEQQAASLEETAAALEQITSNVVSTSRRSGEARTVVREARGKADMSGDVVRNAVTAMGRIEDSSRQITQIISVIDEIAFQTNLLALNAGVEAARAGEAGKGFAVVAQEVRELAQRSAKAAKEIAALISTSAVAVSEGVKLVSETGDGLAQIADLVLTANEHMDAIATAAHEQSAGLSQVNTAVNHMDQATQQNAAMVEEMNAAGATLAQESITLGELLSRFNVGTATTSHAVSRSRAA